MDELLPISTLKQIFCYPWLELKYEAHALFIKNKHNVRSTFRIVSIVLATYFGLYLFFYNPAILEFFTSTIASLKFLPEILHTKIATALATLFSSSMGAYTSKLIVRGFCKFMFGDPEFFLTKERAKKLVELFKAQGIEIEEHTIQNVVSFCVQNLRKNYLTDRYIATKDWEHILSSLIYDANINPFREQQDSLLEMHQGSVSTSIAIGLTCDTAIYSNYQHQNIEVPKAPITITRVRNRPS